MERQKSCDTPLICPNHRCHCVICSRNSFLLVREITFHSFNMFQTLALTLVGAVPVWMATTLTVTLFPFANLAKMSNSFATIISYDFYIYQKQRTNDLIENAFFIFFILGRLFLRLLVHPVLAIKYLCLAPPLSTWLIEMQISWAIKMPWQWYRDRWFCNLPGGPAVASPPIITLQGKPPETLLPAAKDKVLGRAGF